MSLHSDTLFWFRANQSVLFLLNAVLSEEATHTHLIVFGMTRPGLEPMIYHTRGEHANHYATDAVFVVTEKLIKFRKFVSKQYTILGGKGGGK